jgi:predicted helicase
VGLHWPSISRDLSVRSLILRSMPEESIVEKTLAEVLAEFRATATSDSDKGTKFERLTKFYLIKDPIWSEQLANVRLREEAGIGPDVGIDLVADDIASGGKVAIQCKFYDERTYLDDLGTFYTSSGKDGYVKRIVISTSNQWTRNAEEALKNQQIPVQRILLHDMEQSLISWGAFDLTENYGSVPIAQKELRPHQIDALTAVMDGFKVADRGKVIMACGTGKTLVSLRIAEEFFKKKKTPSTLLFLAPSISLLSQTIMEWGQNKKSPYMALAVCSDAKVGKKDEDDMQVTDLAIPASTDVEKLAAALANRGTKNLVIFSTYQSLEIISKAQSSKKNPLSEFDLVVCDEAHRTTGVTTAAKAAVEDFSHFVRIHDNAYVKASKRLYMTATPKIYKDVDNKVAESGGVIASMDDPEKFGEEFYRLGFGTAVERGLLSDYRVLILAVDEEYVAREDLERFRSEDSTINLDDASKLLGCWRGLSKIKTQGEDVDDIPMKRAVAFANTIDASQVLAKRLEIVGRTANRPTEGNQGLMLQTKHVDGKQNALVRRQSLEWLKADPGRQAARILTNARCLSEGIDVPALDAVIFTEARGSQVDIVQAVGRVMRKYDGKNSGYIILPVAITAGAEINSTLKGTKYKVIWDVLNALRAHDDRFDVIVNQIKLNQDRDSKIEVDVITGDDDEDVTSAEEFEQGILVHLPSQIAEGIYAKIVEKVGERDYWEKWAKDVADIANSQEIRIRELVSQKDGAVKEEFERFLKGMQNTINDSIRPDDAIEMLAQHLITKPVFDALFSSYNFAENNPVSKAMDKILTVLIDHIEVDEKLDSFYNSVRKKVSGIDNNASRQKLVTELYEKFFKTAFPKMTKRLGIVYTPVEIVDFILHTADSIIKSEFSTSLSSPGVHVLDPFTGTGTFISRLLQSGYIKPEDLKDKFLNELHACEIILLAYYIGAINIESSFAELNKNEYLTFPGIVLTDTFQMYESKDTLDIDVLSQNNERAENLKHQVIKVIVGNPPYSIGQVDANDDNANMKYPDLDESIRSTYVQSSEANTLRSMYDSYIRAFRWASNRLDGNGLICFVTNGGFLESRAADGFRKALSEEFTKIRVINLRGDIRGSIGSGGGGGKSAALEGGNVFGQGSTTTVAITLLVKNDQQESDGFIEYLDIGDSLTTEQKLQKLQALQRDDWNDWEILQPNEHGDWLNQRSDEYSKFLPLGNKKNKGKQGESVFIDFSSGIVTNKDSWAYNFDQGSLSENVQKMIKAFNGLVSEKKTHNRTTQDLKQLPKNMISWDEGLLKKYDSNFELEFKPEDIQKIHYRPFLKLWGYRHNDFIWSQYRTRILFPNASENKVICATSASAFSFDVFPTNTLYDLHLLTGDGYPLYVYDPIQDSENQLFELETHPNSTRRDGISNWALETFRNAYPGVKLGKEDIFYYTFGVLSSPEFKSRFSHDARKSDLRVPLVKDFQEFSRIGRELFELQTNYEELTPCGDVTLEILEQASELDVLYRLEKAKFGKDDSGKKDKSVVIFNKCIKISNIPDEAYSYSVNGRSAIEWFMGQYVYEVDKETLITNDPNSLSDDPKYLLNLLLQIIELSLQSVNIISKFPKLEILSDNK